MERLVALGRSRLLQEHPADRLDALSRQAASTLGTPMAFVTLFDDQRAYLSGAAGLSGELAGSRQLRPEATYCQYVVTANGVLVVNDSATDPLVQHNPGTVEGGVRAYLGVPICVDGQALGSFCVVDTRPRAWTDEDLEALAALAASVVPADAGPSSLATQ